MEAVTNNGNNANCNIKVQSLQDPGSKANYQRKDGFEDDNKLGTI